MPSTNQERNWLNLQRIFLTDAEEQKIENLYLNDTYYFLVILIHEKIGCANNVDTTVQPYREKIRPFIF